MKNKDLQAIQRAIDALEDVQEALISLSREGYRELMNFLVDEVQKGKGNPTIGQIDIFRDTLEAFLQKSLKLNDST